MADWYGHARTNYFKVKDQEKFSEFCDTFCVEMIEKDMEVLKKKCYDCLYKNKLPTECDKLLKRTVGECKGETKEEHLCGFLGSESSGEIIGYAEDDQGNPIEFDDAVKLLATHLEEGWVAILQEVGAEKLRYITGFTLAVNHKGETESINIGNIYRKAESLGTNITRCEY
jgi:hypothetical protein